MSVGCHTTGDAHMHLVMTRTCLITLLHLLLLLGTAGAEDRGVISDPDGFTNLRAKPGADAAVVAKVNAGEVFEFENVENSDWWKVTLKSGKSGWMHRSRIRMHYTLEDLPEKDEEGSEVSYYGKDHGFDYAATARGAAKGEAAAMKRFFGINDTDGGASETHAGYFATVIHVLGDERLVSFLKKQPLAYQMDVRNELFSGVVLWPFDEETYSERNFPLTAQLLCRKEVVDWPSPDGRFAIRKTFSDARVRQDSRVVKAELIEKAGAGVIADLTQSDIGKGLHREGKVLWSPDSQRFAYCSGELRGGGAAQTAVFQKEGVTFRAAELPDVDLPGRAGDGELKDAKLQWQFVEPERWEKPDVLVLLHHEYFEGKRPNGSIRSIGRTYEITQNFTTGKATARVKKFDE